MSIFEKLNPFKFKQLSYRHPEAAARIIGKELKEIAKDPETIRGFIHYGSTRKGKLTPDADLDIGVIIKDTGSFTDTLFLPGRLNRAMRNNHLAARSVHLTFMPEAWLDNPPDHPEVIELVANLKKGKRFNLK